MIATGASVWPEWLKILVSALAGMATGILLEPLKYWISNWVVSREARNAIYAELGKIYSLFVELPERGGGKTDEDRLRNISLDAFHFYYGEQRSAFYRLREWPEILGIYRDFELTRDAVLSGKENLAVGYDLIAGRFKIRFNAGLDQKRIETEAQRWKQHVLSRMKSRVGSSAV